MLLGRSLTSWAAERAIGTSSGAAQQAIETSSWAAQRAVETSSWAAQQAIETSSCTTQRAMETSSWAAQQAIETSSWAAQRLQKDDVPVVDSLRSSKYRLPFLAVFYSRTNVWSTPPSKERYTYCQQRQKRREFQTSSLSGCQTYVVGMLTMQCHCASQVKAAGSLPANKEIMHWAMLSCVDKSKIRVERSAVCRCHQLDKFVVDGDAPGDSDHHDFRQCGCVVWLHCHQSAKQRTAQSYWDQMTLFYILMSMSQRR